MKLGEVQRVLQTLLAQTEYSIRQFGTDPGMGWVDYIPATRRRR